MAREARKHDANGSEEQPKEKSVEQLIADRQVGKYSIVSLASVWAMELRRLEENRHLSQNEILELALRDLLSGKVKPGQVEKAGEAAAARAQDVKK